jgi:hypothetical protein
MGVARLEVVVGVVAPKILAACPPKVFRGWRVVSCKIGAGVKV